MTIGLTRLGGPGKMQTILWLRSSVSRSTDPPYRSARPTAHRSKLGYSASS
jgi:hypothetical protein